MKTNRYGKKIKKIRRAKRISRKKYKWIFRLVNLSLLLYVVALSVGLIYKSPGTAMGYVFYSTSVLLGVVGLLGLFMSEGESKSSIVTSLVLFAIGCTAISVSWNLTWEIPRYVFLNEYETKVVKVESIDHRKGAIELVTTEGSYEFLFHFGDVPDEDVLILDYLPKSRVALNARVPSRETGVFQVGYHTSSHELIREPDLEQTTLRDIYQMDSDIAYEDIMLIAYDSERKTDPIYEKLDYPRVGEVLSNLLEIQCLNSTENAKVKLEHHNDFELIFKESSASKSREYTLLIGDSYILVMLSGETDSIFMHEISEDDYIALVKLLDGLIKAS